MRPLSVFLLTVLSTSIGQSWGYYPLQIGNRWDYGELVGPGQWQLHYTARIIGDTLINRQTYFIERSTLNNPFNTRYLRQVDSVVYSYTSEGEVALYDFSVSDGDTVSIIYSGNDTITTVVNIANAPVFGELRRTWIYHTRSSATTMYSFVYITDSIGYTSSTGEVWAETCFGAIINGHVYGTPVSVRPTTSDIPEGFRLEQNYPNPFNPMTTLAYFLPAKSFVTLEVFSIAGENVCTIVPGYQSQGSHSVKFDGRELSSGIYLCRITAKPADNTEDSPFIASRKMMLLK